MTALPSIDSLAVGRDIRAFLQPRVPAELTEAALRRAWTILPTIRDFIGIAENEWDTLSIQPQSPFRAGRSYRRDRQARRRGAIFTVLLAMGAPQPGLALRPKDDGRGQPGRVTGR